MGTRSRLMSSMAPRTSNAGSSSSKRPGMDLEGCREAAANSWAAVEQPWARPSVEEASIRIPDSWTTRR